MSSSFPRSAWECLWDAPRPSKNGQNANRGKNSAVGFRSGHPHSVADIGRGASGMRSHAERGNETKNEKC